MVYSYSLVRWQMSYVLSKSSFQQASQHPFRWMNSLVNRSLKKMENYRGFDSYSLTMQPGVIKFLTIEALSSVKPSSSGQ